MRQLAIRTPVRQLQSEVANYSQSMLWQLWNQINDRCFDGDLRPPLRIVVERDLAHLAENHPLDEGTGGGIAGYCDIDRATDQEVLLVRSDLDPRELVEVLAHEMVHQDLAQRHGYRHMCQIGHGPQFDAYAAKLARWPGLKLLGEKY